jgi:hypothetical protein
MLKQAHNENDAAITSHKMCLYARGRWSGAVGWTDRLGTGLTSEIV